VLNDQNFRQHLDSMNPDDVKRNIANGIWNAQKVAVAEFWLADLDDARIERSNRESLEIARSAKNAAWAAAIAAMVAIPIAIVSIVISVLALRAAP